MKTHVDDLRHFLDSAPTSWHAASQIRKQLVSAGFEPLKEHESWKLHSGKRYFIQRGGAICAFSIPKSPIRKCLILGSHTDSPALKLKPNPEIQKENMVILGVEIYGGPLLSSWLNRDLAIAGRIVVTDENGNLQQQLVHIDDSPLFIPQLAIHLDKEVNEKGVTLNKQDHLSPIAAIGIAPNKEKKFLEELLRKHHSFKTLLSFDLFLVPMEPSRYMGPDHQMLASYRIDNLAGAHACLEAIVSAKSQEEDLLQMAVFWDHEEIGSRTAEGAGSLFINDLMERIGDNLKLSVEDLYRIKSRSVIISVDMSHALNPNYPTKSDPNHQSLLGEGVVLKFNADQKYASDAATAAFVLKQAQRLGLNIQFFANRSDLGSGGSTVGPIMAQTTGIPTVDIGIPQLSMHSTREVIATKDHQDLCKLLTQLLEECQDELAPIRSF